MIYFSNVCHRRFHIIVFLHFMSNGLNIVFPYCLSQVSYFNQSISSWWSTSNIYKISHCQLESFLTTQRLIYIHIQPSFTYFFGSLMHLHSPWRSTLSNVSSKYMHTMYNPLLLSLCSRVVFFSKRIQTFPGKSKLLFPYSISCLYPTIPCGFFFCFFFS